ncbi:hypothetical protein C8F01DRAFT_1342903 [Mycena amicta]|nr:hypothetical protein C8F01DRAFT_1342903 [Mycena amicta]
MATTTTSSALTSASTTVLVLVLVRRRIRVRIVRGVLCDELRNEGFALPQRNESLVFRGGKDNVQVVLDEIEEDASRKVSDPSRTATIIVGGHYPRRPLLPTSPTSPRQLIHLWAFLARSKTFIKLSVHVRTTLGDFGSMYKCLASIFRPPARFTGDLKRGILLKASPRPPSAQEGWAVLELASLPLTAPLYPSKSHDEMVALFSIRLRANDDRLGLRLAQTGATIPWPEYPRGAQVEYLHNTVQIVPHVTNTIQDWIQRVAKIAVDNSEEERDVCIVELRGTVRDIESAPFGKAMRQFQFSVGHDNFALVHVSLVPDMHGEQKTKPTQTTVHSVRGLGLLPDLITCRLLGLQSLLPATEKISMVCHGSRAPPGISASGSISLPSTFRRRCFLKGVTLQKRWKELTTGNVSDNTVSIAMVGKYTDLKDSYMSVAKALEHCAFRWVEFSDLEPEKREAGPSICTSNSIEG